MVAVNWKAIGFWFIGSLLVFFGALIVGNIDPTALGATSASVVISYIIGFILIMVGGMFWISTAVIEYEE